MPHNAWIDPHRDRVKAAIGRHRLEKVSRFQVLVGPSAEPSVGHLLDRHTKLLAHSSTNAVAAAHGFTVDFLIEGEVLSLFKGVRALQLFWNFKHHGNAISGFSADFGNLEVVESVRHGVRISEGK